MASTDGSPLSGPGPNPLLRRAAGVLCLLGLALWVGLSAVPSGAGPDDARRAAVVLAGDTVVARLSGTGALPPEVRDRITAFRAAPSSLAAALAAADALTDEARRSGQSRLSGAAIALLAPFVAAGDPEALTLAATARQHQHDFDGALQLLDRALAQSPGHANARLLRATVRLVRGDLAAARADCRSLADLAPVPGFLCAAATATMSPEGAVVAPRLERLLRAGNALDPGLRQWALSLSAEIALMRDDPVQAERALRDLLAGDPGAQREALMLADVLLADGRADQVPAVLAGLPQTDGVALRLLRAATMGAPVPPDVVARLHADQRSRVAEAVALGTTAHAREEAQYHLWIEPDPVRALERALVNWENQREFDDAVVLLSAATAAGRSDAARPVRDWVRAAGLDAPALLRHLPDPDP
jgi:tetratricopeptide (TPR) repeat protein